MGDVSGCPMQAVTSFLRGEAQGGPGWRRGGGDAAWVPTHSEGRHACQGARLTYLVAALSFTCDIIAGV